MHLSDRLSLLADKWALTIGEALPGGWNSTVLACTVGGRPAVLKLTVEPGEAGIEAAALRHWGAKAAVDVRECDPVLGAPDRPVLLHGDAVPPNILLGGGGYRAIDPRAKVGDPAFDAAYWALFADEGRAITDTAAGLSHELGLDSDRVLRWTRAIAVDRSLQIASSPDHVELFSRLSVHSSGLV